MSETFDQLENLVFTITLGYFEKRYLDMCSINHRYCELINSGCYLNLLDIMLIIILYNLITFNLYNLFLVKLRWQGLSSPTLGTAYVHLEKIFHVDAQTVSMAVVISSGGYMAGAIICALVYDWIMPEISFTVMNTLGVVFAFVAFAASYSSNFTVFEVAMFFREVAFGFDDAGFYNVFLLVFNSNVLFILRSLKLYFSWTVLLRKLMGRSQITEAVPSRNACNLVSRWYFWTTGRKTLSLWAWDQRSAKPNHSES